MGNGYVVEPGFEFWSGLFLRSAPSYLVGYWQSDKYFWGYEEVIRSDFSFSRELSESNLAVLSSIESCNSVSLHVRRGDYISNPKASAYHGICGLDYYARAIEYVCSRESDPIFYVFSDDLIWCRENLEFEGQVIFVEGNVGGQSFVDMQLMSNCKHNILANSSFSWWAAWLNKNGGKCVVAPDIWNASRGSVSDDLMPFSWVRL